MRERETIGFPSGTDTCSAWLYRPDGDAPTPIVVMGHGLGAVKEMRLDAFAERFAAAGYACLVFDYRHFGASGGEPRQLLDIDAQLEDWAAAITCARGLDGVLPDKVVVWGSSFGGGHAILTAARDHRVAAAIAQCPFTDGIASSLAVAPLTSLRVTVRALRDVLAARRGKPAVMVDLAGRPGSTALMTAPDAYAGYKALMPAGPEPEGAVAARVALRILVHRPGKAAADIRCPILFCVCEQDSVAPAKPSMRAALKAPRGTLKRYPFGHFDIYLGAPFEQVVADQLAFLGSYARA